MLAKRYEDDGKEFLKLNSVQKVAKAQFLNKFFGGVYKLEERLCDCGADIHDMELITKKDRYGLPVDTVICKKCGLIMTNPCLTQDSLNEFYDNEYRPLYVEDSSDDEFFNNEYKKGQVIYEYLKSQLDFDKISNVLEIGTGMGGILKAVEDNENVSVLGIDLGSDYIEKGKKRGVNLRQGNAGSLESEYLNKFDLIIVCHVLEHFLDIESELKSISKLLSPGGYLYVEVPGVKDIPYSYRDFMGFLQNAHIRHFTLDTLSQLMKWNGYSLFTGDEKIRSIYRYTGMPDNQVFNYYSENIDFLSKLERKNFFLINVRYPLAKLPMLHKIYEVVRYGRI